MSESASTLIRNIREQHGFNEDGSTPTPALSELRGKLERALERLSSDLYNTKTHFLLEFIQNADDNTYAADVIPSLNLRIEDNLIVFECNELGFSADNVKAICDIGGSTKSTKNSARGFIGEKGIGFKSVFTVANEVHISSGPYSFHFDRTALLGMITPVWGSAYPSKPGWTTFHLRLAPSENGTDISAQLCVLRPTLLLFLRQLRSLNVTIRNAAQFRTFRISRTDEPEKELVSLKRIDGGELKVERYMLVRKFAQTPAQEPGREGIEQSEIILAFPVTETGDTVISAQDVHAFLPLRCYGFNFIIQADFITSSSREDVLKDRKWNQALLRGIIDAFLLAVERFAEHPTLRNVWFRYLPRSITDIFFCNVEYKLMSELKRRPILYSSGGTPTLPSQLIIPSNSFRDNAGELLIPEAHLPRGFYYLSLDYDFTQDLSILRLLGLREMTDDDFLKGLQKMDRAGLFGSKSAAWHESVAACILGLRKPVGRRFHPEVTGLSILPLCNGGWALASSASDYMFPPATTLGIPDGLGLQSIAPNIPDFSERHKLLVLLGVAQPDPPTIAKRILSRGDSPDIVDSISYARFFFEHRRVHKMPSATQLRLVDERGEGAQGNELYLDLPGEHDALALRDALSPLKARFLHPDYLSAYPEEVSEDVTVGTRVTGDRRSEWIQWLQYNALVNTLPRVLDGHLTSDFLDRVPELAATEFLLSLRSWWPRLSAHLTQVGALELGEVVIAGYRLKEMYLRRGAFAPTDLGLELPFVPVDEPEDPRWDFLERFGVAIRLNARFFLDKLKHMQRQGETDIEVAEEIYRQLDARFDEDSELIRDAFANYSIIFLIKHGSPIWLSRTDVYWDGPESLTIRALIKPTYESMKNFFFNKLRIPCAPPDALVDELRAVAMHYQRGSVPEEVKAHIARVLANLTEILETKPDMPPAFLDLAKIPMFPVSVPSAEGIVLRKIDQFYVPDKTSKYADVLRGRVAILALPESAITPIRKLLGSSIFKNKIRYLEDHVTVRSMPLGRRVLDMEATSSYSSRVEYIARLVYHTHKQRNPKEVRPSLPQRAKDFLSKLRKIEIIGVQSITTTLSLGPYNEPMPQDVSFEETDEKFTVFFSRTAGDLSDTLDFAICEELSRLLDIDIMMLSACISHGIKYIHKLFEHNGIGEIPVDNDVDRSWLEAMLHDNDPVVPEPGRPPTPSSIRLPRGGLGDNIFDFFKWVGKQPVREDPGSNGLSSAHSSAGVSEQGAAPAGGQTVPGEPGILPLPLLPLFVNFPPTSTDDRDLVRVMGENYAYKILCRTLGDFGPDNWTSKVRNCRRDLPPFTASAEAAFTYSDTSGQLTRKWFGSEKATAWNGRWPRYHIDVKTTRGEENEPFQMSQDEMTTAFKYSERGEVCTNIYVIMRVSHIGLPEPSYQVYADPHRALYDGQLQHVHDIHLQRKTEPQTGV